MHLHRSQLPSIAHSTIIFLLIFGYSLFAKAEVATVEPTVRSPKICLVLSGGGARGYAALGVLKVLENKKIPIDCVVGTSMGAVIGGLYASGLSASDIEQKVKGLNLADIAVDRIARRDLPQTERSDDYDYTVLGSVGYGPKGFQLPRGAAQANQFSSLLQNWTATIPPDQSFDKLPIPFRAIATDLENGQMVVFDRGALLTAIRASMAVPGMFSPVEVNGRLLADGGIVRNLPVDVAKKMGADIVIAVDISTVLKPRNKLNSLLDVSVQMLTILVRQNINEQRALLTPKDILIEPQLGSIALTDFDQLPNAIAIGEKAAQAVLPQLEAFSLSAEAFQTRKKVQEKMMAIQPMVQSVEVSTSGYASPERVKKQLDVPIHTPYNAAAVNGKLNTLLNTREFESVTHELEKEGDGYALKIHANERAWGPNFFRFGLYLASDFSGDSQFNLKLGHRRPWLTSGGLEWRNDLVIGSNLGLTSELRQPLMQNISPTLALFAAPYADFQQRYVNLYQGDVRVSRYQIQSKRVGFDIGLPLRHWGEARLGVDAAQIRYRSVGGGVFFDENGVAQALPTFDVRQYGLRGRITIDQLDEPSFSRNGYLMKLDARSSLQPGTQSYNQYELESLFAKSIETHTFNAGLRLAGINQNGSEAFTEGYTLGGFQRLSAYPLERFRGNYLTYGNLTYFKRQMDTRLFDQSIFLGSSLELGRVWNTAADFKLNGLRKNMSFFLGVKSILGPIHFGVAFGANGQRSLFFQLGR